MASDTAKFIGFMLNICLVASQGLWPRQVSTPGTSEPPSSAGSPTPLDFDQGPELNTKGFLGVNLPKESPKSGGSVKFLDGMDLLDGLDILGSYKKDSYSSPYLPSTLPYQTDYPSQQYRQQPYFPVQSPYQPPYQLQPGYMNQLSYLQQQPIQSTYQFPVLPPPYPPQAPVPQPWYQQQQQVSQPAYQSTPQQGSRQAYQPPPPQLAPYQPPPQQTPQQPYQPPPPQLAPYQQAYQPPPPQQAPQQAYQPPPQQPPQQAYLPPPPQQAPQQPYQPPLQQAPLQPYQPPSQQQAQYQPPQPMPQQQPPPAYPTQDARQQPPSTVLPPTMAPPTIATTAQPFQPPAAIGTLPSQLQPIDDLFGRGTTHPSQIPRFKKYFPLLNQATVAPTTASVTTPPPTTTTTIQTTTAKATTAVTTATTQTTPSTTVTVPPKPPTMTNPPPLMPSGMGFNLFNFGSMGLPSLDELTVSESKCDNKTNFNVGSKSYLATFLTPQCPNMTWSDASDFCQYRGLTLVSPGSPDNAEGLLKLGAMMKQGGGFWTDGFVAHPTMAKVPNTVMWTSTSTSPVTVTGGEGLFSSTGDDGKPQPDNFLFRTTGKSADVEHCVGLFNNKNKDGVKLHDQACNVRLTVVCQATPVAPSFNFGLNLKRP